MSQSAEATRKPETSHLSIEQQEQLPQQAQIALSQVDNLKYFLISAPVDWTDNQYIRRFLLQTGEYVSCVLWAGLFHITGTDIVRCLAFRFHAFGRPVKNSKKFEEGIFSDLRNLKAGNDASLEEPKSPFLDFLYKNNCIRTQKKQKVFYWYSVPHDRLFLDALERDLKREKAGQEATTESKAEPSLSFVYDPSRSLYEQLTHSTDQDQNEQNIAGVSHSRSPSVAPATASYVGPQLQAQRTVSSAREYASSDAFNDRSTSSQNMPTAQMPPIMENQMMMPTSTETMKSDQAYNAMSYAPLNNSNMQMSYDQIATVYQQQPPMSQMQRHSSMTNFYMEPSPAPSFASANSYYDDQSRAVSYEPITPPQYGYNYTNEPTYAHGDNAYHSNGHDMQNVQQNMPQYSTTMPPPPPPRFSSVPRQFPSAATQYSHIEGSPMYKQRRRGSSMAGSYGPAYPQVQAQMPAQMPSQMAPPIYAQMPQQMRQMHASQYAVRHSSDLRRSVSASVVPNGQLYERSASNPPPGSHAYMTQLRQSQTPDRSRQSSPLASIETQQPMHLMRDRYAGLMHDGSHVATQSRQSSPGPVVIRRARSATADTDPYPQKTHTCPIPSCGRDFRRLEHLKRHVRTHTQEKPYQCAHCDKTFSRSDNLAQHRRTHEANSNYLDEEPDSQESDSCAGLTEDVDSPESIQYSNTLPPMASSANAQNDSFDGYSSSDGKDTGYLNYQNGNDLNYNQNNGGLYSQGSMAPPPLPVSAQQGYGF